MVFSCQTYFHCIGLKHIGNLTTNSMGMVSSVYKLNLKGKRKCSAKVQPYVKTRSGIVIPAEVEADRIEFSKKLNRQLAKSEVWFWKCYAEFKDVNDFQNKPLGNFIPDVSNYRFRYVIEVDGSVHDQPSVREHDEKKNNYYAQYGYKVIRVKAYSDDDFKKMLYILNILRRKIIKKGLSFDSQKEINDYMSGGISCSNIKAEPSCSQDVENT